MNTELSLVFLTQGHSKCLTEMIKEELIRRKAAYMESVNLILNKIYYLRDSVETMKRCTNYNTLKWRLKRDKLHSQLIISPIKKDGCPCALTQEKEKYLAELCNHFSVRVILIVMQELNSLVKYLFGYSLSVVSSFTNKKLVKHLIYNTARLLYSICDIYTILRTSISSTIVT